MRLIDLDVVAFDIFDLPPLNEYELYIKNFGRSDTKQVQCTCNTFKDHSCLSKSKLQCAKSCFTENVIFQFQ